MLCASSGKLGRIRIRATWYLTAPQDPGACAKAHKQYNGNWLAEQILFNHFLKIMTHMTPTKSKKCDSFLEDRKSSSKKRLASRIQIDSWTFICQKRIRIKVGAASIPCHPCLIFKYNIIYIYSLYITKYADLSMIHNIYQHHNIIHLRFLGPLARFREWAECRHLRRAVQPFGGRYIFTEKKLEPWDLFLAFFLLGLDFCGVEKCSGFISYFILVKMWKCYHWYVAGAPFAAFSCCFFASPVQKRVFGGYIFVSSQKNAFIIACRKNGSIG